MFIPTPKNRKAVIEEEQTIRYKISLPLGENIVFQNKIKNKINKKRHAFFWFSLTGCNKQKGYRKVVQWWVSWKPTQNGSRDVFCYNTGVYMGDAEARHLDMKLLPLSMDELDMSMLYILRSLGLARSLVLGMHSGIPSRSSRVDWRENSVVASVMPLRGGGEWQVKWLVMRRMKWDLC